MASSIRPWVTTGVAVVGVGLIALVPVDPGPAAGDVRIANSAVDVTTAPNPLEYYPQMLMRSLDNAGDRFGEYLAAPFPIVTAVADNQRAAFADVVAAVRSGDPAAIAGAVAESVTVPVVNLVRVAGSGEPFRTAASLIVRLALPVSGGVLATSSAVLDVVEALLRLDPVGAFAALTNIPARLVDGFLNGRIDGIGDTRVGLLSPQATTPVAGELTGPVAHLVDSLQRIGDTISAPTGAGAEATDIPNMGAPSERLPDVPAATAKPTTAPSPPVSAPDDDPAPAGGNTPDEEPDGSPSDSGNSGDAGDAGDAGDFDDVEGAGAPADPVAPASVPDGGETAESVAPSDSAATGTGVAADEPTSAKPADDGAE
jgi:hypothetical protein